MKIANRALKALNITPELYRQYCIDYKVHGSRKDVRDKIFKQILYGEIVYNYRLKKLVHINQGDLE